VTAGTSHTFVTEQSDAGQRLDRYLAARLPELSRTRIQELIEQGLVRVAGAVTKGARKLKAGEKIGVEAQARAPMTARAEKIPLEILYEDEDIVLINKPAGMTVHAGAGNTSGTLVNALLGRGQALSAGGDALRPGIVHRLDKETSGAILVAKNDFAHAKLAAAFAQREVRKTYLALVEGVLHEKEGRIELAIGRDVKRRTRMAVVRARGGAARTSARTARTDWRVLAHVDGATLVEVVLHTGRTHQIRVHFSALNHPVVGDTLYGAAEHLPIAQSGGKRTADSRSRAARRTPTENSMPALGRNFLHAARLGFPQPRTTKWVEVRAPLPFELRDYLRRLASESGEDWARIDAALAAFL